MKSNVLPFKGKQTSKLETSQEPQVTVQELAPRELFDMAFGDEQERTRLREMKRREYGFSK
ncbi:hypothetical protein [Vibrio sp. OPT46]|uniref:hypothetical protein n=1 Tax=Vibrio sp. OPT46 TaxID=2778645 RepID=UPI0018819843|nr:hypothetical protein [Vibrio sp. OPT46]MBE8572578.1 hypothetical protein [Vibrio sp. OPT46]